MLTHTEVKEAGQGVYAVANGKVIAVRSTSSSGVINKLGWTVTLEHSLGGGTFIYSIYSHITSPNQTVGVLSQNVSDFDVAGFSRLRVGASVSRGHMIGRLAIGMTLVPTHLHFEMRTIKPTMVVATANGITTPTLWPNANSNGYYTDAVRSIKGTMPANEIIAAYDIMQRNEGIIDPSDYIDAHRAGLVGNVTNISPQTVVSGVSTLFTITGTSLPQTLALSLNGSTVCGAVSVNAAGTSATVTCTPGTANSAAPFYIKNVTGGLILPSAAGLTVTVSATAPAIVAGRLNDTGITTWGNTTVNNLTTTQALFPNQDADVGRDALAAAGTLLKTGGGNAGFDYTKLDATGQSLANQAASYAVTPWSCVQDNVTGLMWEVKTTAGLGGLQDANHSYTWLNSDPYTNGGNAGTANGGVCADTLNCDTEKYVAAVNAAGLCGFSDWRLPKKKALRSIVDYSVTGFGNTIDLSYFPNTGGLWYWSASPAAGFASSAWLVTFNSGYAFGYPKSFLYYVRLVRGGQ